MSRIIRKQSSSPLALQATVEVKNNIRFILRERGKLVRQQESHNIWLNLGREYLASLIQYAAFGNGFSPDIPVIDYRIKYMGLGIGGTRQLALPTANTPPLGVSYPGSNTQVDTNPTVLQLERPVRLSGSASPYSSPVGGDVWLGQIGAPAIQVATTQVTFSRLFLETEISYNPFLTVPLSEIMLFTANAHPELAQGGGGVAYDTFDTLSKTVAVNLQIDWTILF